jgi:hypothetical protein
MAMTAPYLLPRAIPEQGLPAKIRASVIERLRWFPLPDR